ncbi:hypothetical protein [Nesterenkonia sp. CF4.4]|uniref:hypothetical protein n=1 Tax=Nesterenkonia sp. CF4.4 TaxID=3373079 RepID=UPI003EE75AA7
MTSIEQTESDSKTDEPGSGSEKKKGKSIPQQLIELALHQYHFGMDTSGKPFGVPKGRHVARPLLGGRRSVRQELAGLFYRVKGITASRKALTEAMDVLGFEAEAQGEPVELFLRAARTSDDEIYVDMGNQEEWVLRITAEAWEILDGDAEVPVLFRRTNLTHALPLPEPGGDLDQLWSFVNVRSDADRQLIKGWLVATYALVGMPCPLLALLGEQGTAKTSSARRVFALFDPTAASVRRPPSDADRLLHSGAHSRGVIYDNLSAIPPWLSDGMCRFVTGEGDVDRALYTDDDARVIQLQGVMGYTTIDVGALNADLAERTLWANLEVIPPSARRSERELNAAWADAYPSMLGGLLDQVVLVLQELPGVQLAERPRMADFAEVLAALDLATASNSLSHYTSAQATVASEIVGTDKFLTAVTETISARWVGTGKELLELLPRPVDYKFWPEPRGMAGKLRRVAPDLRKAGWHVEQVVPDPASKRAKTWILVPPNVGISDADVIGTQLAFEEHDRDVQSWVARVLTAGAAPACAEFHAESERLGIGNSLCQANGCQFPGSQIKPEWSMFRARTKAIDDRLEAEMARTGLDRNAVDLLVAKRSQSTP